MPGLDTTGPNGEGPITGGARGYCANYRANRPEEAQTGQPQPRFGRGLGPCGRGLRFRRGFGGRGFGRARAR